MADAHAEHGSHPTAGDYVQIGIILAVLTAIEVALFYIDLPRAITVPSLLLLTFMKFALVVLWFMHLRFDSRVFRRLFLFGVCLAVIVYGVVAWNMYTAVTEPTAQSTVLRTVVT